MWLRGTKFAHLAPSPDLMVLIPVFAMRHWLLIGGLVSMLIGANARLAGAQSPTPEAPALTRILFLLDGSGSMYAPMEKGGSISRIVVAKRLLSGLVDSLRTVPNLEIALRVYGHQFDRRQQNCKDSKLEVPFRPRNHDEIIRRVQAITPKGNTPITYSLEQSAGDFPANAGTRNVLILITDGIESCGGDPCALGLALQKKRIFMRPFIIGLSEDETMAAEFSCLGQYFDAQNVPTFQQALRQVLAQALLPTSVSVELLDSQNRPTETNVNMTFFNNVTQEPAYDFVHYLDEQGQPDKLPVDAVLTYDVVVHTVPPVAQRNVYFEGGTHNVVRIKAPQGKLAVRFRGSVPPAEAAVLVRRSTGGPTLNVQLLNQEERLLIGTYQVEVLTLPRTRFEEVRIEQSKTTTLDIPAPGTLVIINQVNGMGSLYVMRSPTQQEWVYNIQQNSRLNLNLQPGEYKVVFRARLARGSEYTDVKTFTIRSGATTNVKLF